MQLQCSGVLMPNSIPLLVHQMGGSPRKNRLVLLFASMELGYNELFQMGTFSTRIMG